MLKLKLQYLAIWYEKLLLEKTLKLGKIWLDRISDSMDMNLGELWEMVRDREAWRAAVQGVTKSQTQLHDWTVIETVKQLYFNKQVLND